MSDKVNSDPNDRMDFASRYLEMLIKIIIGLIILEYIMDTVFHFQGKERNSDADIPALTSLVYALVFFVSFSNFTHRIESIKFKEDSD